jgi:hypothetical protein
MIEKDIRTANWRKRLERRNNQIQKACVITNAKIILAQADAINNHNYF